MHPLGWIILQFGAGGGATWLLLRHGLPGLAALQRAGHPDAPSMVSTWLAIATTIPAIIAGSLIGSTGAGGPGAAGEAGHAAAMPAFAALAALGSAMLADRVRPNVPPVARATRAAIAAAVVLAVVLIMERHVTVWTGQAAFALLAVLLWLGGPPRRSADDADEIAPELRRQEFRCGMALVGATLLGIAEGLCFRSGLGALTTASAAAPTTGIPSEVLAGVAVIGIGVRTMVVAIAAGSLPDGLGRRAAAWIAAVGVCGAVGTAALVRLPGLVRIAASGEPLPGSVLAGGFGAWAPAAVCLLAVLAGLGLAPRGRTGEILGVGAITLAIVTAAGAF